jgi:hypothetical protein
MAALPVRAQEVDRLPAVGSPRHDRASTPGGEGGEFSKITKGPIPVSGIFLVSGLIEDALTAFAFGWGCRVEGGLFWMGVTKVSDIFVTGGLRSRSRASQTVRVSGLRRA